MNKLTIQKIAIMIGAIAVIATSVMGFVGCKAEKTPTYSNEEYEDAFYEFLVEDKEQIPKDDFEITEINVCYSFRGRILKQLSMTYKIRYEDENFKITQYDVLDDYPMTEEEYIKLQDSFPPEAMETGDKYFYIYLDKADEQTKNKIYKLYYDWYVQVHPEKLENYTIGP